MSIKVQEINPDKINWDLLVKSVPEGSVYQTTYWAKYSQRVTDTKPIFLIALGEKDNILGSLLIYRTNSFRKFLKFGPLGRVLYKDINRLFPIATWRFGPLIYDKLNFDEIFDSILKYAIQISKKKGFLFLKDITIPIHGDSVYQLKGHTFFSNLNFRYKESATIFINLMKDEDELWHNLKNSARKSMKRNNAFDLNISSITKGELSSYYGLLVSSRRRSKIELPPNFPNNDMWEELGGTKNILEVISVKMQDELLGGIGILNFNDILFEIGPAQSDYSYKNKIYVNDLLKWHVIKKAKAYGARIYDLCGIFLNPKSEKEKKLNQFKEKWGGEKIKHRYYYKFLY